MILSSLNTLLASGESAAIIGALGAKLERSNEAPFWATKTLPLAEAIVSVLIPLRNQGLLFDPEGRGKEVLDAALVLRWCDLVSLKTLAFTLAQSNEAGVLLRTKRTTTSPYTAIDLETLGRYLSSYGVNLANESLDFPIAHYNLHIGIASVLDNLFQEAW